MRTLSCDELHLIHGGYDLINNNPTTAIFFLGTLTSVIGGALGGVIYYETLPSVFIQNTLLHTNINLITLPVAVSAGLGIGGLLGTTIGLGLYLSGMMAQPE